jgi:hypothetical protein
MLAIDQDYRFSLETRARFYRHVTISDGCWLWTSTRRNTGYGVFSYNAREVSAHRFAWMLTYGHIPKGEGHHGTVVMHLCDVKLCVRPDHLKLGTQTENMRDRDAKGRGNPGGRRKAGPELPANLSE